jgi:hypothetical protein
MDTISKVVMIPQEYADRMSKGYFNPRFDAIPDSKKPLIYVTHPDNMEDELWVPPVPELHSPDEDSDDGTCTCCGKLEDYDDGPESETEAAEVYGTTSCSHSETVRERKEMWFYRTGWQNRGVYSTDDKDSKMIYYVDIPWRGWGTAITIRRGNKSGEIVAESCRQGPGRPFEITFTDPLQQARTDDGDDHLTLKFGCIYSRTHKFTYAGRNLAWKQGIITRRLRDLDTDEVIAEFYGKTLSIHKDGKLVILGEYSKDPLWVDVIVTSALTCQQREREIRRRAANSAGGGSS